MHARIKELGLQLMAITDNPTEHPTADDRQKLMSVRDQIKYLDEENGIVLSQEDETDRQGLYVLATKEANRQEDFYEQNDKEWAQYPPCPNKECKYFGNSGTIGRRGDGKSGHYCYECCETF